MNEHDSASPSEFDETQNEEPNTESARPLLINILICFGTLLVVICVFAAIIQKDKISPTDGSENVDNATELPAVGKHVTVKQTQTNWIASQRRRDEGNDVYLPELSFVLEPRSDAGNGALRILFYNNQGDIFSDPRSVVINQGQIISGDQRINQLRVTGTRVLRGQHEFILQEMRPEFRWVVKIFEGPNVNAAFSEYQLVYESRIRPTISKS